MKRARWGAAWEIFFISLVLLFLLAGIIFFSLLVGKHLEMMECLKHSASVLISLPVAVFFAVCAAFE